MCWKPKEMSRPEFDSLLRDVVWETKDDEVSRIAERIMCRGLGELYSLELLMRLGMMLNNDDSLAKRL